MIGELISHYRVLKKLGEGGMGEVYLAEDTELDRKVALKFLPPQFTEDPDINARFKHEAKAAAALNHPNVVTIYQVGEHEGRAFIAMEYVEGQSLREMMNNLAKVSNLRKVVDDASQICEGLNAAHQAGIVHRDIKPDNILMDKNGRVKIADFGLAKARGRTKLTQEGSTLGTLTYMSPEQLSGAKVDHRSDIWSVGVVLYEMITGRLPFQGEYDAAVTYSIAHEEPEPLARYKTGVSEDLQRIIDKALRKDPETRYQSAADLLADLKEIRQQSATKSFAPPAAKRRVGYGKTVFAGVAVLAIVLVYAIYSGYFSSKLNSERKMLAVLPFENLGPPEQEYFADGLTEEMISRLAGIRALGVISRTSIIQYKNTDKTLEQIGAELGVDYVLQGTVRWQPMPDGPAQVRVTPQLIRVSDDTHLWTNRYSAVLTDIFQVQSEIAERVSEVLNVAVLASERRSLESIPTDNLEAYDTYLRGNDYFHRGQEISSEPDFRRALEMYHRAVELDPDFALAYSRISLAHHWMHFLVLDHSEERLGKQKAAADKALEFAPDLPEAHLALGYYYTNRLAHDLAQKEFTMALQQQPNNSEIYLAIGNTRWRQGKFEEALPSFKKAAQLHPRHGMIPCFVGGTYLNLKNYPEAARFHDRSISLIPNRSCPYYCKALIYLRWQGDTQKARSVLEEASQNVDLAQIPSILFPWVLLDMFEGKYEAALNRLASASSETFEWDHYYIPKAQLYAQIYGLMDRPQLEQAYYDSACIFLETKLDERPEDARIHSSLGIAYAGLGRKEQAIREGKRAIELLPVSKDAFRGPSRIESLARIYVMVGEYDAALDQLEWLLPMPRGAWDPFLELDPIWAPLRDHPRYQKLLKKAK